MIPIESGFWVAWWVSCVRSWKEVGPQGYYWGGEGLASRCVCVKILLLVGERLSKGSCCQWSVNEGSHKAKH